MKKNTASGFSLIELSIAMIVVGFLISIGFSLVPNYLQSAKVTAARTQMKEIQNAIEGFAVANNRLPCPDTTTTADGVEVFDATNTNDCAAYHGFAAAKNDTGNLPYRTLGLSNNRDPWGRIIKYAALMMRSTDAYCTTADTCDMATTNGTISRANFCAKLSSALKHSQDATITTKPTTDIHIARLLPTNVSFNSGSLCSSPTLNPTVIEGSVMAYILASSGFNDANQSGGTAGIFDGMNNPGNSLCFENPDRVLRFLDGSEQSSTGDNYDDIVLGGSVSGLISRLECN